MTKKEREVVAALEAELALARAWRLTEDVERDVLPPRDGTIRNGWDVRVSTVEKHCTSGVGNGRGWGNVTSQNPRHLYSTELLALRALRRKVEREAQRELARIDALIARATQP